MIRISLLALIIVAFAMPLHAQAAAAELGQKTFKKRCAVCHNPLTAQRKIGPGLHGVFGHEAESGIGRLTEARFMSGY